jgi:subfamily B ATP-binding cassette protein MsbA
VLLLDEATSALDSESERMIQSALEKLSAGKTVVAIAHRLSTVLSSDMIVVMSQGRIIDTGTNSELLEKSPAYRKLHEMQFHHEPAAVDA